MPKERCPIADSFVRTAVRNFKEGVMPWDMVSDTVESLNLTVQDIEEGTRQTQMLRSFYCLWKLYEFLIPQGYRQLTSLNAVGTALMTVPTVEPRMTREGVIDLIDHLTSLERKSSVMKVETSFDMRHFKEGTGGSPSSQLDNAAAAGVAQCSEFVLNVAKFLRPKLKNEDSLSPMGRDLADGMWIKNTPSGKYVEVLNDLANIWEGHFILGESNG